MDELVIMQDNQAVTTSVTIANVFGKRHANVLRDIEEHIKNLDSSGNSKLSREIFKESTYKNRGKSEKQYLLNRDGFSLLAMSFTGIEAIAFKIKYIEVFNHMEKSIKQQINIPTNSMEALRLMFEVQEETGKALDDHNSRIVNLEVNQPMKIGDYNTIGKNVSYKVYSIIAERKLPDIPVVRKTLFQALNGDIKTASGARNRSSLKDKDYDMVYNLIQNWAPSLATLIQIETAIAEED